MPPRVDYLYVEQEVLADDTRAVDAVLKADKVRWSLVEEEKEILAALEKGKLLHCTVLYCNLLYCTVVLLCCAISTLVYYIVLKYTLLPFALKYGT